MLEIGSYRLELNALRRELTEAWAKTPYPIDEIARLNARLRDVLDASGYGPVPMGGKRSSPETRAKVSAGMRAYWARKRARKTPERATL